MSVGSSHLKIFNQSHSAGTDKDEKSPKSPLAKTLGAITFSRPQGGYESEAEIEKIEKEPFLLRFVDSNGKELAQLKSLQLQPLKNLSNQIVSKFLIFDVIQLNVVFRKMQSSKLRTWVYLLQSSHMTVNRIHSFQMEKTSN